MNIKCNYWFLLIIDNKRHSKIFHKFACCYRTSSYMVFSSHQFADTIQNQAYYFLLLQSDTMLMAPVGVKDMQSLIQKLLSIQN
jgi:hypothetical protein